VTSAARRPTTRPVSLPSDWLVDRRHCPKNWSERAVAIRAKIEQALVDMPENDEIKRLLGASCR
jgi:hypothetical protein